ncbi:MAG: hypothetical protein KDA96_27155 [Planctomycetaceae bacterium]|nr:hypothetical protein [Planctomycetaceae bacterium]
MTCEPSSIVARLGRHAGMPHYGEQADDLSSLLYEFGKVRFASMDVERFRTNVASVIADIAELNRISYPIRISQAGKDREIAERIPYFLSRIVSSLVLAFGLARENNAPSPVQDEIFSSLKQISLCVDLFLAGDVQDLKAELDV